MTFQNALLEAIGDDDAGHDITLGVVTAWHATLGDADYRFWQGYGSMFSADGHEWIGTMDASGTQHMAVPTVQDLRDGSAPNYTFEFPYLDQETHDALLANPESVRGGPLIGYYVLFKDGEGVRPQTPLMFFTRLTMETASVREELTLQGNRFTPQYKFSVTARSSNSVRSYAPNRTVTPVGQRDHARYLGVAADDAGADFVPDLASKAMQRP